MPVVRRIAFALATIIALLFTVWAAIALHFDLPVTVLLIAEGEPTAVPVATEAPAAPVKTNSTTGSYLPFIGLGVLLLIIVLVAARFARGKSRT